MSNGDKRSAYIQGGIVVMIMVLMAFVINNTEQSKDQTEEAAIQSELAKQQSTKNNEDIRILNQTVNDFVDRWDKRIQISNEINNESKVRQFAIQDNILNNLTSHRTITNQTFRTLIDFVNDRNATFNATLDKLDNITTQNKQLIIAFNATNEEERGKAVASLHEDHEEIKGLLNGTK